MKNAILFNWIESLIKMAFSRYILVPAVVIFLTVLICENGKMPNHCWVPGCKTGYYTCDQGEELSLFKAPNEPERL